MTSQEFHTRSAIIDSNKTFMDAFEKADAEAAAAVYTEDAQIMPPGTYTLFGRVAIESFWMGAVQAGVRRAELKTLELDQQGETVIEAGRATLYDETGFVIDETKYLAIWKQEAAQWKIHRYIWNSDPASDAELR